MSGRRSLRRLASIAVAIAGIVALVLLVRSVGPAALLAQLGRAKPWIVPLLLLELVRIGTETAGLAALCGRDARRITAFDWLRFHLVANAACIVMPGGRAISEGIKITRLSPVLGAGRAVAVVAIGHACTMISLAILSFAALPFALARSHPLAVAAVIHAAACIAGAFALVAALRRGLVPGVVARWLGRTEPVVEDVRREMHAHVAIPGRALAAKVANRLAQAAQFGILLVVFGSGGVGAAFAANVVGLVGSVIGELSPAQVGGTDGAMLFAAESLGIGAAAAIAIATVSRIVQLAGAGLAILAWPRPRTNDELAPAAKAA
jgi:hypothetical protein